MKKNYVFAVNQTCTVICVEESMLNCYDDYKVIRKVSNLEMQMIDLIIDQENNKKVLWSYQMDYEVSTSEWEFIFATHEDMIHKQEHFDEVGINLRYGAVVFC